jgi:hypothetical protein
MMYVNAAEFFPSHGQQREVWLSLSPPPTTNSHIVLDGWDAQLFDEQDDSALGSLMARQLAV